MERVIVCCLGSKYKNYEADIRNNFEIAAFSDAAYPDGSSIDEIPCIDRARIMEYAFDKVIVCSTLYYQDVRKALLGLGVPNDKIFGLDALYPFLSESKKQILIRECDMDGAPYEFYAAEVRRPKYAKDVTVFSDIPLHEKVGVVLQGPVKREDDFTLETVKLYRKLYPDVVVIVSGWKNEDDDVYEVIEREGAIVCRSDQPEVRGYCNINMQIVNTMAGLRKAEEIGCKYVLKSRTDQRMYAPNAFYYMVRMHKKYKLNVNCAAEGRILTFGTGVPYSSMPYYICDYFDFGLTSDIIRYFNSPYVADGDGFMDKFYDEYRKGNLDICKTMRCPEVYFCSNYLTSIGFDLKWTKEDGKFFSDKLFIRIEPAMVDWIWPKYTFLDRRVSFINYNGEFDKAYDFWDWLFAQDE